MKSQYRILSDLMKLDEKISRLSYELLRLPEEIARIENILAEKKGALEKSREGLTDTEKKLRDREMELKEKEDYIRKAEGKMMEVKTNIEYQAAIKENQTHKDEKSRIEEEILMFLARVEEVRKEFTGRETEFKGFEKELLDDKKKIEAEISRLQGLHQEQVGKRNQISSELEPKVSSLYQRMTARLSGSAVAIVDNSQCLGCNMRVRPQLFNEILSLKIIHQCPSCSRILIPQLPDDSNQPIAS